MATVTMSISEAIDVLEKTGNPTVSFDGIQCDCLVMHSTPNYKWNRTKDLDELKNSTSENLKIKLQSSENDCKRRRTAPSNALLSAPMP
jgi:hypothetical protein